MWCVCENVCLCVCVLVETRGYYQVSLFTTLHLTRLSLNLGFTDWLDWLVSETQGTPLSLCLQCWRSRRDHSDVGAGLPFLVLSILYSPSHSPALSTALWWTFVLWLGTMAGGGGGSMTLSPHCLYCCDNFHTAPKTGSEDQMCSGLWSFSKGTGRHLQNAPQPMSHSSLFCFFHNYEYKTLP